MATPTPSSENASFLKASAISNYDPVTRPLRAYAVRFKPNEIRKDNNARNGKRGLWAFAVGEEEKPRGSAFTRRTNSYIKERIRDPSGFMNKAVPPLSISGATGSGDLHIAAANLRGDKVVAT